MHTDRRLLAALFVTTALLAPALTGCGSSGPSSDTKSKSESTATGAPAERHTRQFIPELGIYITLPHDWVAFADGVHNNKGLVTYQVRPKWESSEFAQYVRIRKLTPSDDAPEVKGWLAGSNADAVGEFVRTRQSKIIANKPDSWDGPNLPGASATLELEKPAAAEGKPAAAATPKIYVAFVGQGDQRWQIATSNTGSPSGEPWEQFFGEQADAIARSAQLLK
ncbi:putative small lipoprotein YifL [Mycobacteroides chelonae]|nr:putative small lipoprotein YifL [Mycobacteroides chelonae]